MQARSLLRLKYNGVKILLIGVVVMPWFLNASVLLPQTVHAISDPSDTFTVSSPGPNTTARGNSEIRFVAFDNQQTTIPTLIKVMDSNCQNKLRTILNTNRPSASTSQLINWNTAAGYSDGGVLPDATYCLSICVNLKLNTTPYTTCNQRKVTIRNVTNQAPIIRSLPKTKIYQGENYSYQISASDPNNDPLTYTIIQKPNFLSLQGNTLKATNVQNLGSFFIKFRVTDDYAGFAEQSYTLIVSAKPTPTPAPTNSPAASPTPTPANNALEIKFAFPTQDSLLKGKDNTIEWSYKNLPGQMNAGQTLSLEYKLKDTNQWNRITEIAAENIIKTTNFNWDVSQISKGDYLLHLLFKQNTTNTEITSLGFKIDNQAIDQTPNISVTFTDLKPDNGTSTKELRPDIAASIHSLDKVLVKETIAVYLDNNPIKDLCTWQEKKENNQNILQFVCKLNTDLTVAEHKVKVVGADFNKEWSFAIISDNQEGSDSITILGIKLPRQTAIILISICVLFLCLILLPFILFRIWRSRVKKSSNRTATTIKSTNTQVRSDTTSKLIPLPNTFTQNTTPFTAPDPAAPVIIANIPVNKEPLKTSSVFTNLKEKATTKASEIKQSISQKSFTSKPEIKSPLNEPLSAAEALAGNGQTNPLAPIAPTKIQPISNQDATDILMPVAPLVSNKSIISENSEPVNTTTSPTEPLSAVSQNSTVTVETTATNVDTTSDDLPAWLKDIPSVNDDEIATKTTSSGASSTGSSGTIGTEEKEEDGSDPYGLGDFTIGK